MGEQGEFVSIGIDQLRVGLFVTLDMDWLDHRFLTNSFKIKDEKQLRALRELGLKTIRYSPAKSDRPPLPSLARPEPPPPPPRPAPSPDELAARARKRARVERLGVLRQSVNQCEKLFASAAATLKEINRNLYARPEESVRAATRLIDGIAGSLLVDKDLAIHAMNDKVAGEDVYFHSLNVSVLAMMLAREMGLEKTEVGLVGLGALFHDIGKTRLPDRILRKVEPLTPAEQNLLAEHPRYGEEIGHDLRLPSAVIDIILHHHEALDGSGYPDGLDSESLALPARVVAIANTFDNLCNQPDPARSLTPYEAVSSMYARQRHLFDPIALSIFIRCMGVYPPGTVVRLSERSWGMVVSVNVDQPLRPVVLIHDPEVPREEAILVDLAEEAEVSIAETFRPADLPRPVFEYLSPRRRVTYYFDEVPDDKKRR